MTDAPDDTPLRFSLAEHPAPAVRYAIFGEHRFCPVCGQLPALATALDALDAETIRLDALAELPGATRATLWQRGEGPRSGPGNRGAGELRGLGGHR